MAYKDETPKPYAFEYGVHDDYAGTNFAQNENADGSTASGSYSVLLPDGRTQTVTYHADQVRPYFIQGGLGPSHFRSNKNKCVFNKRTIKVCVSCS